MEKGCRKDGPMVEDELHIIYRGNLTSADMSTRRSCIYAHTYVTTVTIKSKVSLLPSAQS